MFWLTILSSPLNGDDNNTGEVDNDIVLLAGRGIGWVENICWSWESATSGHDQCHEGGHHLVDLGVMILRILIIGICSIIYEIDIMKMGMLTNDQAYEYNIDGYEGLDHVCNWKLNIVQASPNHNQTSGGILHKRKNFHQSDIVYFINLFHYLSWFWPFITYTIFWQWSVWISFHNFASQEEANSSWQTQCIPKNVSSNPKC